MSKSDYTGDKFEITQTEFLWKYNSVESTILCDRLIFGIDEGQEFDAKPR